jgi:hypothetical protein
MNLLDLDQLTADVMHGGIRGVVAAVCLKLLGSPSARNRKPEAVCACGTAVGPKGPDGSRP